jgi:hypothetical protein
VLANCFDQHFHPDLFRNINSFNIIYRYIVIEVNPIHLKHDTSLILKPTSLFASITKKVQQLHGDFGVAAVKSGIAGMYCQNL